MKDKIFFSICFGFIFGVLLHSFIFIDFPVTILIGIISFSTILFLSYISKNKWGIIAGIFILAFSFGILRFNIAENNIGVVLDSWSGRPITEGQSVSLSGLISDEPDIRENNQKLTVSVGDKRNLKILVTTDFTENYRYGDVISFYGKLSKPKNFDTDQGKEFDYVNYLKKDGIFYVMSYPKIEIISRGEGNKLKNTLFVVKNKFLEKINMQIPEPESLLLGGLILGEKSAFSQDLRQSFVNTGTIHIVALSGYNVTIVAEWIMKVFMFLPQRLGIGVGILAILFFILMTGASSTAIRAGVMATLALFARATGRNYDVMRALILAGIVMISFNPYVLAFDVSFQLSFIATVAVIFLAPKIEKYFVWIPKKFELRDIVSVTVSAYIFVLPFILYKMGNLSLTALPANVLILPFIPLTMLFGFLTGFTGIIWYILSVPFGFISHLFLSYELFVVNFLANLPFSSFTISNFPLMITLAIYVYFICRLFGRSIKKFFIEPF